MDDPAGMLSTTSPRLLRDGTPVVLRLQTPADRSQLADLFARLSPRSRYQRFLAGTGPKLPSRMLDALADVDGHDRVGLLALRDSTLVGAARYLRRGDDRRSADVALTVADELQGRGLGRLLLDELRAHAAERGVARFEFDALATNRAAMRVMRSLGADLRPDGALVAGAMQVRWGC